MHKGQALLMILLVLGVAITIGLSVASRSVTEVNLSGTEDQSAKALQAAEAGVEKALGGVPVVVGNVGSSTFNVKSGDLVTNGGGSPGNDYYKYPFDLNAGDVVTINLKNYTNPNLGVCWGKSGAGQNTAVEAILYYSRGSNTGVGRAGYDPNSSRLSGFNPVDNNGNNCPATYAYSERIQLAGLAPSADNYLFMRIRVLQNSTAQPVAIAPYGNTFPVQGKEITSTGVSGDAAQKVHVVQPNADLPFMFDSALFSGGTLSQ